MLPPQAEVARRKSQLRFRGLQFGQASYRCPLECLIQALTVVASKVGFL